MAVKVDFLAGTKRQVNQTTIASLTDNSSGSASDTIAVIGATYDQDEVRDAVASLAAKIEALTVALENAGITST